MEANGDFFSKIKKVYSALKVMETHKATKPSFSIFIEDLHTSILAILQQSETQNSVNIHSGSSDDAEGIKEEHIKLGGSTQKLERTKQFEEMFPKGESIKVVD